MTSHAVYNVEDFMLISVFVLEMTTNAVILGFESVQISNYNHAKYNGECQPLDLQKVESPISKDASYQIW